MRQKDLEPLDLSERFSQPLLLLILSEQEHQKSQWNEKMEKHVCSIILVLVFTVLVQKNSRVGEAGSIVKNLPGFPGPLPFQLETGYIGVDESEDVQFFYYFTRSESDPESDPLMLWLTGGPGCSAISGLAYEFGPVMFEPFLFNGRLPKLMLNPYSWTKAASIIFLDQPVGAGFSYARTAEASHSSDLHVSGQIYEFLRKWLVDHPEFISSRVYIGGDSYAGFIVPIVTQLISDGNEAEFEPKIDLKGYLVGNPFTSRDDPNYRVAYAHRVGLISDELYQSLKLNCNGQYEPVDPSNALCLQYMQTYNELLSGINTKHILAISCPSASLEVTEKMVIQQIQEPIPITCREDAFRLVYHWANDESVQEALHVRKGSISEWIRCNYSILYTYNLDTAIPYHANLSVKGYRSLVYSGDHDMLIPHIGTQAWVKSLNYQIIDDWRQWIVEGQVAGYTRTYANKMTFATVKGGGHTAAGYKPEECLGMFKRWISSQPL